MNKMSDLLRLGDRILSPLLLAGLAGWTIAEITMDVKKDGNVVDHANILHTGEYSRLSNITLVLLITTLLQLLLRVYRMIVPAENDEKGAIRMLRQLSGIVLIVSSMAMNGLMRTPSKIHNCPLQDASAKCDISELKYDDSPSSRWLSLAFTAGVVSVVMKLSELLSDMDFNLSKLIDQSKASDQKSWAYIVLTLLALAGSFVTLLISDENDIKASSEYKKDDFLSLAVFYALVGLLTHSILVVVTMLSKLNVLRGISLQQNTYTMVRWALLILSVGTVIACPVVLMSVDDLSLEQHRGLYLGILLGAVFLIFCILDFITRPTVNGAMNIEFIALNEIPLMRSVVVISMLSLLSIVSGVVIAKQIDMALLSASVVLLAIADILGKNDF